MRVRGLYKISTVIGSILLLCMLALAPQTAAADLPRRACYFSFGNPIQTHSQNGPITFQCDAKVSNDINNLLPTALINNPTSNSCNKTCGGEHCSASGAPAVASNIGDFALMNSTLNVTIAERTSAVLGKDNISAYAVITAKYKSVATFTDQGKDTNYYINVLRVEREATVNLVAGNYWINELDLQQDATIIVKGGGLARIYINKATTFGNDARINVDGSSNHADNLFIYGYNNLTFSSDLRLEGFIYSKAKVTLGKNVTITGAVLAAEVLLQEDAIVNYDANAAKRLDMDSLCPDRPPLPDHFVISHEGDGMYCATNLVKITAMNKKDIVTGYIGTVILSTGNGNGNWSKANAHGTLANHNPDDGLAAYTFSADDYGVATFTLDYNVGPTSVDLKVYDQNNPSIKEDDQHGKINFTTVGFVLTTNKLYIPDLKEENNSSKPVPKDITNNPNLGGMGLNYNNYNSLISSYDTYFKNNYLNYAYKNPQIAGVSDEIFITAFGQVDDDSCRIIREYNGNKDLKFWQSYIDPTTGKLVATIDNNAIGAAEGYAHVQKTQFTSGTAKVVMRYRDVGKIRISVKDDTATYDVKNGYGKIKLRGSTFDFVVKPAKFAMDIPNNPAATSASGGIFVAAGAPFAATVTVQDNDGNITPNYGNEVYPAKINIYSSTMVSPTNGRNGSDNRGTIISGDQLTKIAAGKFKGEQLKFDEVGIIKLTPEVAGGDYLGAGNVRGPESSNVGRFTPHHFSVTANVPSFKTLCQAGGFGYIGQAFKYNAAPIINITALTQDDTVTKNYTGSYLKLASNTLSPVYQSNSSATLNSAAAEIDIQVNDNGDGSATVMLGDGGGLNYTKIANTQIAPFNAEISLTTNVVDSDNVAYLHNPFIIGGITTGTGITFSNGNKFYQGRIAIANNYGSELIPLKIPMQVQYFNGTVYEANTTDSCTVFDNANNLIVKANPNTMSTVAGVTSFNNGIGKITLNPPSPRGKTGYFNVEANLIPSAGNLDYLQHDWLYDGNSDGVFADNPQAQGTFGIYEGKSNIIYIREITD